MSYMRPCLKNEGRGEKRRGSLVVGGFECQGEELGSEKFQQ